MKIVFSNLIILLMIISFNLKAQIESEKWVQDQDDPFIYDKIVKKKEITLQNEFLIKEKNSQTGVYDSIHYTGHEHNQLSLLLHLNSKVIEPFNLLGFEVEYWKRLSSTWLLFNANYVKTRFVDVTLNRSNKSSTNRSAEENYQRGDNSNVTLMNGGIGIGYRFRPQLSFWKTLESSDVFHSVSSFLTYNLLHDDFRATDYTGLGMNADYQINKRFGDNWGIGGKFSYHLAFVNRKPEYTGESNSDTRLNLSWITLAISLAYFY